jgi:hypothetical protein
MINSLYFLMRLVTLFLLTFSVFQDSVSAEKTKTNEHVSFQIRLKEKTLRPGSSATILISMQPKKGIHINLETPTTIKLDSSEMVKATGNLILPKNPKDNYLDVSRNIQQAISLSKDAKPGALMIKGVFTYFYCSDAEGWCSKFKQPFELTARISK